MSTLRRAQYINVLWGTMLGSLVLAPPGLSQNQLDINSGIVDGSQLNNSQSSLQGSRSTPDRLSAATNVDDGYLLGPGDVIGVSIFDVPEYSGAYPVLLDGTINVPIIGAIPVKTLTLDQTARLLERRFTTILKRPLVTVTLQEARLQEVALSGEVNRPGVYSFQGTATLTTLLAQAGGVRQSADVRTIEISRPRPGGALPNQALQANLWALLQEGDLSQDIALRGGDRIFIPTQTDPNPVEAQRLASASFAPQDALVRIAVLGQVRRPGPYVIGGAAGDEAGIPTVTNAIQEAGGITQQANIREIEVRRVTAAGEEEIIALDFWTLLQGQGLSQDIPLQQGDTIFIPEASEPSPEEVTRLAAVSFSPTTITVNLVGEVRGAGVVQVPPNTPLNQAILAAGGLNSRASKGRVKLIRLNSDGTVTQRDLDFDLAAGINPETNPPLMNNDTVIVGRNFFARVGDGFNNTVGRILSPFTSIFSFLRIFDIID